MRFFYSLLLFGSLCGISIEGRAQPLSDDEFFKLKQITTELLQRFPPSEYFYVGFGRSPTTIIAHLNGHGLDAVTVPLTAMSIYAESRIGSGLEPELYQHISTYLPKAEQLGMKKILLIDFVSKGRTLRKATTALRYVLNFQERGETSVQPLALHHPGRLADQMGYGDTEWISTYGLDLYTPEFKARFSEYEPYSPVSRRFGKFPVRRTNYDDLVSFLKERISGNPNKPSCREALSLFINRIP